MRPPRNRKSFLIVISFLASTSCFASLGEDAASVAADQAHMRAQRRITQTNGYTVHELQAETGTVVREFVSPQGKVFGVAWQGTVRPDLQQLLGTYYDEFQRNAPTRRAYGPITIQTSNIVLQSGGHMRALTGRAYVPELIPQGVRIEDIR